MNNKLTVTNRNGRSMDIDLSRLHSILIEASTSLMSKSRKVGYVNGSSIEPKLALFHRANLAIVENAIRELKQFDGLMDWRFAAICPLDIVKTIISRHIWLEKLTGLNVSILGLLKQIIWRYLFIVSYCLLVLESQSYFVRPKSRSPPEG